MMTSMGHVAWIRLDEGRLFDGTPQQFAAEYFPLECEQELTDWAAQVGIAVELLSEHPGAYPASAAALGAQMREHATRAHLAGVSREVTSYLWRLADSIDGGTGPSAHHGCPDVTIPTADCTECDIVLDAEVGGGDPARSGTIFDRALPS